MLIEIAAAMTLWVIICGIIYRYIHLIGIQLEFLKTILAVFCATFFVELGHFLEKVGHRDGFVIVKVADTLTTFRTINRTWPIDGNVVELVIPFINSTTTTSSLSVTYQAIGASETRQAKLFNVVVAASATILASEYV